jgi:hypothetical protein
MRKDYSGRGFGWSPFWISGLADIRGISTFGGLTSNTDSRHQDRKEKRILTADIADVRG